MKTILFVNHVSVIGGGSYCLLNILKELDREHIKPIVLLKNEGPLATEIQKLDIPVYFGKYIGMLPLNRKVSFCESIKLFIHVIIALFSFLKFLFNHKCDAVYFNSMMLYHFLIVSKAAKRKTIIHIRENWPVNNFIIQRFLLSKTIEHFSDCIFAINNYSANMFSNLKNKNVRIVYDWICMDQRYKYMPLSHIFNEDVSNKKVFLYLGGPNPIKGPYEVISHFYQSMTSPDYRLLVVGNRDSFSENIRSIFNQDSRIVCIPPLYEISHLVEQCYCVLSYFKKPHANLPLAESIILNTPIVAANTPEAKEYSLDGELAILFDFNNEENYLEKINNIDYYVHNVKEKLSSRSYIIKQLFDKDRNAYIINNTLLNL